MRLKELTGYKTDPHYQQAKTDFQGDLTNVNSRIGTLVQFQKYLMSNGFVSLGSGQGGITFEKQGYPWVFKIFTHDPAYLEYVQYAKKHKSNPYIPKFKGNLLKINNNTFVVRMEKLTKPSGEAFNELLNILRTIDEPVDFYKLMDDFPDLIKFINSKFPGILAVLIDISRTFAHHGLDLHRGNFMSRNGQLVITDPIV